MQGGDQRAVADVALPVIVGRRSVRGFLDKPAPRAVLGLRPEEMVLFGVSLGFQDPATCAHRLRTPRAELAEFVTFHDKFEEKQPCPPSPTRWSRPSPPPG